MFIHQLDLEEFRGVKKCKEPIKLSKFNILIGRNNSGKSTILGALSLLPIPSDYLEPIVSAYRIDFLKGLIGGASSLVYAYSGEAKLTYKINNSSWKIEINEKGQTEKIVIGNKTVNLPPYNIIDEISSSLEVKRDVKNIQRLVFFIPNSTGFIKTLIENLRRDEYWNFVTKQRAHFEVASQISQCVDDKYTEILMGKDGLYARKEFPKTGPLYIKLEDLGDGTEKAIAIMLFVNAFKPDVVLWDDFETTAHPTLIRMLLNWLGEGRWQVVLSTHSIDVLDRLLEVKPKDAKVIQLKKTAEDILLHKELSLEELEAIMEANQDPRLLVDALQL
ncbi:MAG: AAA family ATPase [Candidatus Bathyarchaeales archaeon]